MYTLRQFRASTKEAFDKARESGSVEIKRGKGVYILLYSGLEGEYPNRPQDREVELVEPKAWPSVTRTVADKKAALPGVFQETGFTPCRHGYLPSMCRFAKNGKPCK